MSRIQSERNERKETMKELDARGLQCPKPLMMAKKELDAGCGELTVKVSNEAAVSNLSHLAKRLGREVSVTQQEGYWDVCFGAGAQAGAGSSVACECLVKEPYAVFVGKDHVGEGDETLGKSLMKMALYTLSESGNPPAHLLFMNSGVKLVAGGEQAVVDSVSSLVAQGTEVLVCGTCLDFYGVKDQLAVGEVSNMYDILGRMQESSKTITL